MDFVDEAELGLLTELATGLRPPGGALEEEEEEDLPPSTESSSSKFLSAKREVEMKRLNMVVSASPCLVLGGSCSCPNLNAESSSFHRVISEEMNVRSSLHPSTTFTLA